MGKGKILSALTNPDRDPLPLTRRFALKRKEDKTGNSGTGTVAIGIVFPSGFVVMEWVTMEKSLGFYHSIAQLEKIHGHNGATEVVFVD